MASQRSNTITQQQVQAQLRPIVLKLTTPTVPSTENEAQTIINDLKIRVNNRFNILMKKFVIDENEQINAELMEKLQNVKDTNTFLTAVLTHLYGKAVEQEENTISPYVKNDEKEEINAMVEQAYAKENKH